jgi:hypothetical protein
MMLATQGGPGGISGGGNRGDLGRILQRFLGWKKDSQAGFGSGLAFGRDLWDLKSAIQGMGWMVSRICEELGRWDGQLEATSRERLDSFVKDFKRMDNLAKVIDDAVVESALSGVPAEEEAEVIPPEGASVASEVSDLPLSKADQLAADKAAMWWIKPTWVIRRSSSR